MYRMETMTTRQVAAALGLSRQGVHLAAQACGVKPLERGNHRRQSLWRASDLPALMARRKTGRPRGRAA
jgi:hypothetical protein